MVPGGSPYGFASMFARPRGPGPAIHSVAPRTLKLRCVLNL
jgi:hypothetical protein